MHALALPIPSPKQDLFLRDTHRHVAFGGARGGGKSWAVRFKAIVLACKYAGIKICIVRRTYPELIENHVRPLKEILKIGSKESIAKYNDSRKEMTFQNGSIILFKYCSNDKDLDNFQGIEFDVLFIDEATQFTEYQVKCMNACVRGTNGFIKRTYYTCNPGGIGHGWVKRIFIDRKFELGEDPDDYSFIQSLVTDNKALMATNPEYMKQLESLPPKIRDAWLLGDWNTFQGAFFEEFRVDPDLQKCIEAGITPEQARQERRYVHVIEPFDPPKHWRRYVSYDWGYGKPFSFGFWVQDDEGILYRILELYGCTDTANEGVRWSNKQQFDKCLEIMQQHPWLKGHHVYGVADPSIWDGSKGVSAAEEAEKHCIDFSKGINDRIPGWMQIRERLKWDQNGFPMIYFFNNCKAAIRTLPLLVFDEHKVEDCETIVSEDHAADDIRYMCMFNPIPPRNIVEEFKPAIDPLDQFKDPGGRYTSLYNLRR